jgi:hypothetical protein
MELVGPDPGVYGDSGDGKVTPSCRNRKLNSSAVSSILLLIGCPPEWPAFVKYCSSTGLSRLATDWSKAVIFLA